MDRRLESKRKLTRLPKPRHSKRYRVFWGVLFFLSSAMFVYQLQKVARAFFMKSTLISVEKRVVESIEFPTITLCRASVVSRSANVEIPKEWSNSKLREINLMEKNLMVLRAYFAFHYLRSFNNVIELHQKARMDPHKFFLSNFKSSCIFGVHHFCDYPSNITDFFSTVHGGACYQINPDGRMKQMEASFHFGLSIILFLNQSDYVPFSSFDTGSGIFLKIHEHREFPFPEDDGLLISPGYLTRISLQKTRIKRLKTHYSPSCTDGEGIDLLYPGRYSVSNCKRSCILRDGINRCGTGDPLTMMLLNRTGKQEFKKLNKSEVACFFRSGLQSTNKGRIECQCPIPCDEEIYRPTIVQTKWPSEADLPFYQEAFALALNINRSLLTKEYIHNNFLHLSIYFDQMCYEEVSEKWEWTLQKLISDVGGQMGIWLGASILSVLQLSFSAIDRLHLFWMKKKDKVHTISVRATKILPVKGEASWNMR